ncbi:MAG: BrnT family toxin [Lachnospiraceae bacterium]|nr:BrnT family toxin [Lachnospiraceae bacterium]
MEDIRFVWDVKKAGRNLKKHGVSFEEAITVFFDDNAILFDDPDHSEGEDRFILLGMSKEANLLMVCHCTRENDTVIRIISARKATRKETEDYIEIRREW